MNVATKAFAGSSGALQAGVEAPDSSLRSTPDQSVRLSEFRGRSVILTFYPADGALYAAIKWRSITRCLRSLKNLTAELMGISVDGTWCHAAFCRDRKLHFPLLSEFEPKGEVARRYGVYRESEGVSERAIFVINPEGVIHWSYVSPVGVNPGAAGIISALEELKAEGKV